jgi:hypothetical protein
VVFRAAAAIFGAASGEALTMPAGDGGRLNQYEGLLPPVPQSAQAHPEQTVGRAKTSVRTSEDAELVTQCKHLEHEVPPGVQDRADPRRDGQKDLNHRVSVWPAAVRTSNDPLWTELWRTTGLSDIFGGRAILEDGVFGAKRRVLIPFDELAKCGMRISVSIGRVQRLGAKVGAHEKPLKVLQFTTIEPKGQARVT